MPKATKPIDHKAVFYRRTYNLKKRFPQTQRKLQSFNAVIEAAARNGLDSTTISRMRKELKQLRTLSQKTLANLRDSLRREPGLKLKKEYLAMLVFTNHNARFLLGRLEGVKEAEPQSESQGLEAENIADAWLAVAQDKFDQIEADTSSKPEEILFGDMSRFEDKEY